MNILFFTSNKEPKDGWSVVGYSIIKNSNNVDIEVFSSENKNKITFTKDSLKSELFFNYRIFVIIYDILVILLNKIKKPDIIHCNVEYYAPVAMILAKIWGVPYTITAHGTYGVLLPSKSKIYKIAFERANKVICVSNFTKKRMIEENIQCNYEVILNGVDKGKFKINKNIIKENIITFVGNLKSRKGLNFLLDSLIEVYKINDDIKLVIIGSIDKKSDKFIELKKYIDKHKLNVEFIGKISEEELIKYYQKAKLNILPSQTAPFYFEGFGLIHVEANACGTLTVGTKNSGNEDAIDKNNGFLVKYGDIEELSSVILKVFSYKNYPDIDYNKLLDWKDVSKQYYKIFSEVIEND